MTHHLVLFLNSCHCRTKLCKNFLWNGLSLHLVTHPLQQRCEEHSMTFLHLHHLHPYQRRMEQQSTKATQRNVTRDFSIPPGDRKHPTQRDTNVRHNFPHCLVLLYSCIPISAVTVGSNWQEAITVIHNQQGSKKDTQGWFHSHLLT